MLAAIARPAIAPSAIAPSAVSAHPAPKGTLLFTNMPDKTPIKAMPWGLEAVAPIGADAGYAALDEAIKALGAITDATSGAAAVLRRDGRFYGSTVRETFSFSRGMPLSRPTIFNHGGLWWKNEQFVALVDGSWVERYDRFER